MGLPWLCGEAAKCAHKLQVISQAFDIGYRFRYWELALDVKERVLAGNRELYSLVSNRNEVDLWSALGYAALRWEVGSVRIFSVSVEAEKRTKCEKNLAAN